MDDDDMSGVGGGGGGGGGYHYPGAGGGGGMAHDPMGELGESGGLEHYQHDDESRGGDSQLEDSEDMSQR